MTTYPPIYSTLIEKLEAERDTYGMMTHEHVAFNSAITIVRQHVKETPESLHVQKTCKENMVDSHIRKDEIVDKMKVAETYWLDGKSYLDKPSDIPLEIGKKMDVTAFRKAFDNMPEEIKHTPHYAWFVELYEDARTTKPIPSEMLVVDGLTFGQQDVDNLVAVYNNETFTTPLQESLFRAIKVCKDRLRTTKPVSVDLVEAIWNAGADCMNQWSTLEQDEKQTMCDAAGVKYDDC